MEKINIVLLIVVSAIILYFTIAYLITRIKSKKAIKLDTELQNRKIRSFINLCSDYNYETDDVDHYNLATIYEFGLTDLKYIPKTNTLNVTCIRPGIFIGKAGSNINIVKKLMNCNIHIIEKKFIK